ncbi:MAG: sigma-54 dependent transcriptional regulator [Cytophagaceae bacterium]|nr:sigma-54 dependent transcriptional regulator [Cytophagaceae bacterium]
MPEPIPVKILIVDDDVDVLLAARLLLKRYFKQVDTEKNPERIPFLVTNGGYDIVLLDMNFTRDVSSGKEGFDWLDRILDIDPKLVVVMLTAYGDVEMAVRAIKAGAADFVLKPWENDKLLATLQAALAGKMDKDESKKANPGTPSFTQSIIGNSLAMQAVFDTIERVAATNANVLILGENGTGKDLVARAIHQRSLRHERPFVPVDLGALTESLFESELFGHVKGAFTDAREDRAGRFEEAQGGTIFLDEIGNISLPQQARLLNVLQQRTVTRVGTNKARPIDVRLICATNAPIHQRVAERNGPTSRFRQDLLYRINTIELRLPPLRERPDDIVPLAEHFLKQYRKQYNRPVTSLSTPLVRQLRQYGWPGNVRELQHAIERAVILTRGTILEPEDFFFGTASTTHEDISFRETMHLEDVEKQLIQKALQKYNGNITEVARDLGLSRQALYRRLEKYGL